MTTEQKQDTKETAETKKALAKIMGGEMITVNVQLFSPFTKFLEEYLRFFGSKKTLEDLCRDIIYEQTGYLYNELQDFAATDGHFLASADWYWKHPHLSGKNRKKEETEE